MEENKNIKSQNSKILRFIIRFSDIKNILIPYLFLVSAPFLVFWRFLPWTSDNNSAYIYQDTALIHYPFLVFLVDSIRQYSEIPLWSWGIYGGMPFHSSFMNHFLYPLNLLFYTGLLDPSNAGVYHLYMLIHFSIGGVGFYLLARSFNYGKATCVLGALVYCFSGFTSYLIIVGSSWFIAHAWLPLTMFCLRKFVLEQKPAWILFGVIFYTLIMSCLMPNVIIPITYFLIAFFIYSVFIEKRTGNLLSVICWGIVWLLLSYALMASSLLPIIELSLVTSKQGVSSFLHARDIWGEQNAMLFMKNYFLGGDVAHAYLGAVGGLLALIGIITRKGKYYLFWVSVFIIAIFAAYTAKDFIVYEFIYIFVPQIKNLNSIYRNVGSIYVISGAFLIMTAISYGMRLLIITKNPFKISRLLIYLIGGLSIIIWIIIVLSIIWIIMKTDVFSLLPNLKSISSGIRPDLTNLKLILGGITSAVQEYLVNYMRWLFLWVLIAIIISTMRIRKYRGAGIVIVLIIIAIDILSFVPNNFEKRMLSKANIKDDNLLVKFESPYIVGRLKDEKLPSINSSRMNMPRNNTPLIQGKDNTGGYYPVQPLRIAQAMYASGQRDHYVFMRPQAGVDLGVTWPTQIVNKLYGLDPKIKGRAWIVPKNIQTSTPPLKELTQEKFDPYEEAYLENEDDAIKGEYGNRYFNIYKIINEMLTPNEKSYAIKSNKSFKINDDLTLLTQTPNSAVFKLEKDVTSGSLFFSDNWYPGWVAYVNGKRVPLYVANYTFKGILLNCPKSSVVEFVFNPPITKIGNIISIIAFLLLVMLLCMRKTYHPILSKVKSTVL